jgi:hypothetical protein
VRNDPPFCTATRCEAATVAAAHNGPSSERSPPAGTPTPGHPGGLARSYLTLSTLATVLPSWDDHPHHRLTMPLQHGVLSLRWPFSTLAVLLGEAGCGPGTRAREARKV